MNKYLMFLNTDVFLSSYPKSGNTWVRFIIAHILNEIFNLEEDINFENIAEFVPLFSSKANAGGLKKEFLRLDKFPVVRKAHFFNPKLKFLSKITHKKIIYIIRNPFDALVSYFVYCKAEGSIDKGMTLSDFVAGNISSWVNNVNTFSEISQDVLYYENIQLNPLEELQKLKFTLQDLTGIRIQEAVIQYSIDRSDRKSMSALEQNKKSNTNHQEILLDTFKQNSSYDFVNTKNSRGIQLANSDQTLIENNFQNIKCPNIRKKILSLSQGADSIV